MMRHIALICVAMTLAGCASTGGMFGSRSSEPAEPSLAPETSALSAAEIQKALAGKSWRWTSAKSNLSGVTLYASDGTSLVGYLCESFAPAPFIPQGKGMSCQPISGGGGQFRVGQADFTLA
jgi:hypothetical protein